MNLATLIEECGIKSTYKVTDANPFEFNGDHYKVRLTCNKRAMTLIYSKGYGHKGQPPETLEVLECLHSDCQLVETVSDFEQWCGDLGYDTDSRKALKTYNACKNQANKLKNLLGDKYTAFLQCES